MRKVAAALFYTMQTWLMLSESAQDELYFFSYFLSSFVCRRMLVTYFNLVLFFLRFLRIMLNCKLSLI